MVTTKKVSKKYTQKEIRRESKWYAITLQFPFPLDLNPGLSGRKRRNSNSEAVFIVSVI